MPLPINGTLSLLGFSRPGDAMSSVPKQAMIVRMSAETLEALENFPNHPPMNFEFGGNPGIYIGETFFPVRPVKEGTPHELYLRASSAAKKMAPLKLYANVTGKFTVERELDDGIRDRVRESTIDAANQRQNRTTILLDTPPDLPSTTRKRKDRAPPSNMFRKAIRQSDMQRTTAPSAMPVTGHSNTPEPPRQPPRQSAKEGLIPLRKRMVHCLAVNERTSDQVVKLVGGPECSSSTRLEVLDMLDDVAELSPTAKASEKSAKMYRLKPESWREVRPYEWPKLTDMERTDMARAARFAFKGMGIPESDHSWNYIKYRNLSNPSADNPRTTTSSALPSKLPTSTSRNPTTTSAVKSDVPKRPVTSKEARAKKAKPKSDPKAEIMMKDESIRAASRPSQISGRVADAGDVNGKTSSAQAVAARKLPGSGYKLKPTDDTNSNGADHHGIKPANGKALTRPAKESNFVGSSKSTQPAALLPNPQEAHEERRPHAELPIVQKIRRPREESDDMDNLDSDKVRRKDDALKLRGSGRAYDREREEGEHSEDTVPPLKRKKPNRDIEEFGRGEGSRASAQKKRRTDSSTPNSNNTPKAMKPRDPDLLTRPERTRTKNSREDPLPTPTSTLPKIRKDLSTKVASPEKRANASVSSSSNASGSNQGNGLKSGKINGIKSRRRSPIYTSSEEDAETPRTRREPPPVPFPTPPMTTSYSLPSKSHSSQSSNSRSTPVSSRPLPSDHASLRARYTSSYVEYLATFQKLLVQKGKIDNLLKNENGSAASFTDSDGDELMDPEELTRLTSNHRKLHEELETIQQVFVKAGKVGSPPE